ncbi:MAG: phosphatase [Hyphomicrobiales bacterium]|nr:MAG: phosphatase [Hyphomicrobiales bacterium]
MSLKALIFDVDGTLAETEEAHREAFNKVFAEYGLNWSWSRELYGQLLLITGGKERIRHFLRHHHPDDAARFIAGDDEVVRMHERKTAIYMDMVRDGSLPLRPGIERIFNEAREAGVKLAISTTTNTKPLYALFEGTLGTDVLDSFEAIAAGDMVAVKKPAPDLYLLALEKLDLPPSQCLAMEDSRNGLVSAGAAGLETLITVNTYTEDQDFSEALAIVSDLGEPDQPMRCLRGDLQNLPCVTVTALQTLHGRQ